MSPPASLEWAADRLALHRHGVSIDPVTAWAILTEAVLSKTSEEHAFFSVLDTAEPATRAKNDKPLQNLILIDPSFGPDVIDQLGAALARNLGLTQPRLFQLPLLRTSLPEDIENTLGYTKGGVSKQALPCICSFNDPQLCRNRPRLMGRSRPKVIVGIIDYAINLAHARFQHVDERGTRHCRIAHAWWQDGRYFDDAVPFGHDFDDTQIARALDDAHGDDEAALRALGILSFSDTAAGKARTELAFRTSHGTHVLDLAAGADPSDPAGMDTRIIAVALPDSVSRDTTGTTLSLFFEYGLAYILQRYRDMAGIGDAGDDDPVPLYVCASLGFSGGPRGGKHLIERSIEKLIQHHETKAGDGSAKHVKLFVSAGNSNLARGYAASSQGVGEVTLAVPWRLQPGDQTPNHLEAWIAYTDASPPERVSISLVPPGTLRAAEVQEFRPGESKLLVIGKGGAAGDTQRLVGRVAFEELPGGLFRLSIALGATDPGVTGCAAASPGAWDLTITAHGPQDSALEINAWILRDDDPVGHSANARQSFFDAPDYVERDERGALLAKDPANSTSVVRRGGSLSAIATGSMCEAVGGFVHPKDADGIVPTPAPYSGTPLSTADRLLKSDEAVTWSAPCETSLSLFGILAAGTRSGSVVTMNGTSAAVPQVVRTLASARTGSEEVAFHPAAEPDKEPEAQLGTQPIRSSIAQRRPRVRGKRRRRSVAPR